MNKLALLPALALSAASAFTPAMAADAAKATTDGASAMRVVRDPVTGQLRAPTEDEAREMAAPAASAARAGARLLQRQTPAAAQQPLLRSHAGGASSMRMTDEMTSQVVAVRRPSGAIAAQCHDNHATAQEALAHAAAGAHVEAKE
jgi:hypothetical protein